MQKVPAHHKKITSLLLLASILVAPIATPQIADAQRAGTLAAAPTASITVGGKQSTSVTAGAKSPTVQWNSTNGNKFRTLLRVNNAKTCGIKNNQVWSKGKTARGNYAAPTPTQARAGCVLTFVYEVTDRVGRKVTDTAVIRYEAAASTPTTSRPTTPVSQKLKLLTPNGGEKWMLNSNKTTITWTPEPHADGMVAYLEKKSGKSFVTVGKIVEARKGSIQWLGEIEKGGEIVYATPGTGYYIRLVNTETGETDRSNAPFTILASNAFEVDLQPADENNYLEITQAGPVRLTWDARTPGVTGISCAISVYDNQWNLVETKSVPATGMYEVYAELPDPSHNNDNHYTLANLTCDSSIGTRGDYVEVISNTVATKPTISIEKTGPSTVQGGENLTYTFSGTDLQVPSNVRVELYSPVYGNAPVPVVYGNIGESHFTRQSEYGSLYAPKESGEYRLTVCDDNTPNPDIPFKPLCAHSNYFTVIGATSSAPITVQSLSEFATVDEADFPGDNTRGIYEFEIGVYAGSEAVFIPDFFDVPAFQYTVKDAGVGFNGSATSYISETNAPYIGTARRYRVDPGQYKVFTLRVELNPSNTSVGHAYGIQLNQLNYGHSTSTVDQVYSFPDNNNFETNIITLASAANSISPNIAQGDAGAKVTLIQAALKKAGLFNEEITGYFGSITRAAVKAFQREHSLDNIGAVGPRTAELLNQVLTN